MSEFISKPHSHEKLLEKLPDLRIPEFIADIQEILGLFNSSLNEHEAVKLIILLGKISANLSFIEKLVRNPPHTTGFFKKRNNLTEQLQNLLKAIREELNKLEFDNKPNQSLDSKSPAPGA